MARALVIEGLDAGTPVADAAPKILALRLGELARHFDGALARPRTDPEEVHDLRVATRRLRAALRLLGGPLAEAGPSVKRLGDALGRVRDLDVLLMWLDAVRDRFTVVEQAGPDEIARRLRDHLPALEAAMSEAIASYRRHLEPALSLHLATAGFPGVLGGPAVRRRVARRLQRVARRVLALPSPDDALAVHALRIAGKKARYDLELVEPVLEAAAAEAVVRLKQLQEVLGELHDRDARLALLPEWVARASPAAQPGAVRLLRETLDERTHLADELLAILAQLRDGDALGRLAQAIARGAGD